ncbi:NAD(P)H-dependent oxidoreductase [Mesotoga sp. H07.pep.5.3]|nr:NAD(P)H-dependent oxidoreductase [Mesotoga sp. H07.pep.5.3]
MRLLVFNGSPREVKSNTLTIVNHFLEEERSSLARKGLLRLWTLARSKK